MFVCKRILVPSFCEADHAAGADMAGHSAASTLPRMPSTALRAVLILNASFCRTCPHTLLHASKLPHPSPATCMEKISRIVKPARTSLSYSESRSAKEGCLSPAAAQGLSFPSTAARSGASSPPQPGTPFSHTSPCPCALVSSHTMHACYTCGTGVLERPWAAGSRCRHSTDDTVSTTASRHGTAGRRRGSLGRDKARAGWLMGYLAQVWDAG